MEKIDLRKIDPRFYDGSVLNPEDILRWFDAADACWAYEGEPSPDKPHVELTSGLCSDGFFDCLRVLCYPNIAEILGRQAVMRWRGVMFSERVDWVVSSSYAAITFGYEVAKALPGAKFMMVEKDEANPKGMVWRRMNIPAGQSVLQAEELITTSGTFQEVMRAVKEGNSDKPVLFFLPVLALIHRPPKLPVDYGGRKVVALVEKEVHNFKPEECPYCKVGSPKYRAKTHWEELTGKK